MTQARIEAMLTHYLDFNLRTDAEFPSNQLLAALYLKLHRALVQLKAQDLAVSFPGYSSNPIGLGKTLRVFGSEGGLLKLMEHSWLAGIADHVEVSKAHQVPDNVSHRSLIRVQAKSNPERLRRRHIKRHGLTVEQAKERIPDNTAENLNLPFLSVRSYSTGQAFLLFLRLGPSLPAPSVGTFNAYGLSATATIPWF